MARQTPQEAASATRSSLLQRVVNWDDQESWKEFFALYRARIRGSAMKAGLSEHEADEVVQETFVELARKMRGFKYDSRRTGYFRSWLSQLTRWRVLDQFRRRARHNKDIAADPTDTQRTRAIERVASPAKGEDNEQDEVWMERLLNTALDQVRKEADPKHFQIFDLYVNQGWDAKRVASAFGTSVGQVYLVKHRVCTMIRDAAERHIKQAQ